MNKLLFSSSIFLLFLCSCNQNEKIKNTLTVQENEKQFADPNEFIGDHKTKAMILGVFHFSNPNLDTYKNKYTVDIFSKKRQDEINQLIQKLARFKPTKILIETNRVKYDSIVNNRYSQFLKNKFDISKIPKESYQIGFKLAKKLGHHRIYCLDVSNSEWFGSDIDWDNYDEIAYLKSKGQYEKANRYNYEKINKLNDSLKTVQTLTDHFIMINNPSNRLKNHQQYLTSIIEGAGDHYVGADVTARWYQRNLKIFANAYDITDFSKEDRILLIYGSGHVWQLRQFFTDSPDFDYIEVNDYLIK